MRPLRFRKDLSCPLQIAPKPASAVGDDRLAAALGALTLDNRCAWAVLDAGTALTANLILPPNRFEGGWIVPGLELSLRALAGGTAQLPDLKSKAWQRCFKAAPIGRSTKDAMLFGATQMQTAFARSAVGALTLEARRLGVENVRIALTGGGAEWLALSLKDLRPELAPLLAHCGLFKAWSLGPKQRAARCFRSEKSATRSSFSSSAKNA
jgi:type III pantothenate kinase